MFGDDPNAHIYLAAFGVACFMGAAWFIIGWVMQ